ncbi:MAG: dipeptide epimerase, partial [Cloacibacillus sp.]|nr:dipeptide epimerase [Cloacibacillus sp.]
MKIKSINTGLLLSPLKTPFITAVRSVDVLTDVIVRIETDSGLVGWGAAPPTAKVTGETVGSITGAVNEVIAPLLLGSDCEYLEGNLELLDGALLHNTSAKAAVDIALHDIWGKSIGQPVWKLFGGNGKSIASDVTISLNSPEVMAADTVAAVE